MCLTSLNTQFIHDAKLDDVFGTNKEREYTRDLTAVSVRFNFFHSTYPFIASSFQTHVGPKRNGSNPQTFTLNCRQDAGVAKQYLDNY